jgi:hypothetical protein
VFTDPIEYLSVSTRENLLHPKLQGVGLQFLLCLDITIGIRMLYLTLEAWKLIQSVKVFNHHSKHSFNFVISWL